MSLLAEAKLDVLLARHAELEAQLLSQVGAEDYVRMPRELAELNPVVEAVKAWRATSREIADLDALKGLSESACSGLSADEKSEPIVAETMRN